MTFSSTCAMRRWAFATSVLLVLVAHSVAAPTEARSEALTQAVTEARFSVALRRFSALAQPTADDEYLVGFALMRMNRPDDAAPHLEAAKARGWSKWTSWPSAESLLDRVAEVRRLAPPALDPQVDAAIEVHAGPPTTWSEPVLRAVPEFAAVGRRIFGADLPRVRLYLFAERAAFDRFFRALFGVETATAWQDGTGATNVVMFCEQDSRGRTTRRAGDPDTIGNVAHEFGHAWCETYLMERCGRNWKSDAARHPWLREGVANVVASLREPEFLERRTNWLKTNAKRVPTPTFADLTSDARFYKSEDAFAHYCLSSAFVADLVGPLDSAPAKIRAILDAIGKTGDVEASVSDATGKDLRKEFDGVVARFW